MGWIFFFSFWGGGGQGKEGSLPKKRWLLDNFWKQKGKCAGVNVFIMSFTEQRIQMNCNDIKHITVWPK